MLNLFTIPEQFTFTLKDYFCLQWSGKRFSDKQENGTITLGTESYLVVYKNCTAVSCMKAEQVRLSFRQAQPEYELCAYVLVKIVEFNCPLQGVQA